MWITLLIASALTGGKVESTSQVCDTKLYDCHNMYPEAPMKAAGEVPDEEELETVCPDLVKMADCFAEYREECKELFEGLFPFYDRDGTLYKEICNKTSVLRSKYLTNVDCYKRIENASIYMLCYNEAISVYEQYVLSKETSDPEVMFRRPCMQMPYVLGCVAAEVQASCGDEAAETFVQVEKLKDSTDWIKYCLHNLEYKNEIYTDFLPSIQIAENLRRQINKVLDVLKEEITE
ncbi:uncharacterized protein LOC129984471 [Argiope bruennichi]|uniref:uncharacterized protein LOC129984471 n=1 Tax=Argiope bruennichi TaxID=94029 RepID=UPI002493FD5A|nr:uncharacterized protein LOC129984471 [Argiope bruennichi]